MNGPAEQAGQLYICFFGAAGLGDKTSRCQSTDFCGVWIKLWGFQYQRMFLVGAWQSKIF